MTNNCAKKRCSVSHSGSRSRLGPNSLSSPILPLTHLTREKPDGVRQIWTDPAGMLLLLPSARANPGRLARSHSPLGAGSTLLSSPEDSDMTGIHPSPANNRTTAGPSQDLPRSGLLEEAPNLCRAVTAAQGAPILPSRKHLPRKPAQTHRFKTAASPQGHGPQQWKKPLSLGTRDL